MDKAKKGGVLWSVNLRASQRAQSPAAGQLIFFLIFENPRTPGGGASPGSIITTYSKKNHVELFYVFFKARVVFL